MRDFLDIAEDLMRDRASGVDHAAFARVFEGIHHLRRAHSNAQLDVQNIETVLAAFEMAELFGTLGDMAPEDVKKLSASMRTLIVDTIENRIQFKRGTASLEPPRTYSWLALLCKQMLDDGKPPTIITFNYDTALDYALHYYRANPSYCLDGAEPNGVRLLKLHGSLNWATSPDAPEEIVALPWSQLTGSMHLGSSETLSVPVSKFLGKLGDKYARRPVIVAPSWSKLPSYQLLAPVWRRAARELRDAEYIDVAGFSLAASDGFFQMLYGIGTTGRARIRRFAVADPNIEEIRDRFENLLGQAALPQFKPVDEYFDGFVENHLRHAWGYPTYPLHHYY
ncbi:SIR2 family protein [Sandaracinus amylolyticus]|uniref:SIR2 family protein n=1 Tax=Sandaracinus amylolyticus TaxID=927083 RepID=UPI001F1C52C8|nr:SIR2 family protein [Sandaracinus amylolyticus]UJR81515.1 Deacetylase sirtuin-type domain-containing protein [Sandaracinus amylolyticus]